MSVEDGIFERPPHTQNLRDVCGRTFTPPSSIPTIGELQLHAIVGIFSLILNVEIDSDHSSSKLRWVDLHDLPGHRVRVHEIVVKSMCHHVVVRTCRPLCPCVSWSHCSNSLRISLMRDQDGCATTRAGVVVLAASSEEPSTVGCCGRRRRGLHTHNVVVLSTKQTILVLCMPYCHGLLHTHAAVLCMAPR